MRQQSIPGNASPTFNRLPRNVVKDVVLEVVVGLCDVLEGAVPAGVMELELVVEVVAPERVA
jgi:hypothetical protein